MESHPYIYQHLDTYINISDGLRIDGIVSISILVDAMSFEFRVSDRNKREEWIEKSVANSAKKWRSKL